MKTPQHHQHTQQRWWVGKKYKDGSWTSKKSNKPYPCMNDEKSYIIVDQGFYYFLHNFLLFHLKFLFVGLFLGW